MTTQRFVWQREKAAQFPGMILNVGSNEDPAYLKQMVGLRLLNCDIETVDSALNRPNKVDILFDAVKQKWPFPDNYAHLVILGDIIEHLKPEDCITILKEARRVSPNVAITVPNDARVEIISQIAPVSNPYIYHQTVVTEKYLRDMLENTGWQILEWKTVDYTFVPEGYFVLATRK
jgi:predicted SAM-dependent methyltransferase